MTDDDPTRELLADGDRLTGVDLFDLLIDDEGMTATELTDAVTQVGVLAGCLWNAAVVLVEQIFEDLDDYLDDVPTAGQLEDSMLLGTLPAQYALDYTRGFARQYLVTAVDLTARLSQGWQAPACYAQQVQLEQWLNLTEVMIEVNAADVPFDWRAALQDVLATRAGVDPADAPPVDSWFVPFTDDNGDDRLPPYAED